MLWRPGAGALFLCLFVAGSAAGQEPADSAAAADTAYAGGDTVTTRASTQRVAVLPEQVPDGPFPPGDRFVFTRDSVLWNDAETLADLLEAVPGGYVARAGFVGSPEYFFFAGRGAAALEVYWDGEPLPALGRDSLYIDPATIPLSYLSRVDLVVTPGRVAAYLVTERHGDLEPRSRVAIASGDFDTGAYAGLFQKRWPGGLGISVAGDFHSTDGGALPNRSDERSDLWARVEWVPDSVTAAAYQIRRQGLTNDPLVLDSPVINSRDGARTDVLFTLRRSARPRNMGVRFRTGALTSSWTSDSLVDDRTIHTAFLGLGYGSRRLTLDATGRIGDGWLRNELDGRVGFIPARWLVVSGRGRWQRFAPSRETWSLHGSAALLAGPLVLSVEAETGNWLETPAVRTDSIQGVTDYSISAGLRGQVLSGHIGLVHRDAFAPTAIPHLSAVPGLGSTLAADYTEASLLFRPASFLSLSAWYSHPSELAADFQPPKHGRVAVAFRSKFWRTFRSGAFDLKLEVAMDFWSRGRGGLDSNGDPVELEGVTFYDTMIQIQLVDFNLFWVLRNAYNAREQFIPGIRYPTNAQFFGVKWVFAN